ncbi:MAG TPA: SDR family oxidoreductase [Polyangiaceae bacterium]|nr:SDR family oxidoreductase [Polyangiaceae bacterium]
MSPSLDVERLLRGRNLVVAGATGFLGKVWLSLVLTHYPAVGRLHLLVRRKGALGGVDRFWQETIHSEAFRPLREVKGNDFESFLREKVVPIEGDIVLPFCGVPAALQQELRGSIAALVNASGVVDFEPPLDVGLEVNAFGVQNLVALARALGDCPLLHTSTCFVAGKRTGFVEEEDPRVHPFPRAHELERAHWDPDREIAECLSIIEQAKQRAEDAFRQSHFLNEARVNLKASHEPLIGAVLEREVERVKRSYVEAQLAEMGNERARFWGWPNTYTYTKSIGEQIAAASGLQVTIVRPAIVETSVKFPMKGWNEGINTSAPLIYAIREGQTQLPGSTHNLDMIPCDMVAGGMVMALCELLDGTAPFVYQLGASDCNPVTMARIFELTGLYKRKYHLTERPPSLSSTLQGHVEGALFPSPTFEKVGPKAFAKAARGVSDVLHKVSATPALRSLTAPATSGLEQFARSQERIGRLLWQFAPFTADYDYTFRCDHVREARARLSERDRAILNWEPELLDWRQWFLEVHTPALERWVFPEIERRRARPPRPLRAHETVVALLEDMTSRHDLSVALQHVEEEGLTRVSYRDLRSAAQACAARLIGHGVKPGERVLLIGDNHPNWAAAFLGILYAGAAVVPIAADFSPIELDHAISTSGATHCILDQKASRRRLEKALAVHWHDLETSVFPSARAAMSRAATPRAVAAHDVALLSYNSDGIETRLSHAALTRAVADLSRLHPLCAEDRLLSLLPLHHPLEILCGLLLPLSRGARVIYSSETSERPDQAFAATRPTVAVGSAALWDAFAHGLVDLASQRVLGRRRFELMARWSRKLRSQAGINAGRLMFSSLHAALGGELQYLISGGPSSENTRKVLNALGMQLKDCSGVMEEDTVLNVSTPFDKEAQAGHSQLSSAVAPRNRQKASQLN